MKPGLQEHWENIKLAEEEERLEDEEEQDEQEPDYEAILEREEPRGWEP
jgi:hypothetical protein